MDFELSDEQRMIVATVRQISERFRPFVGEWERAGGVPPAANREVRDTLRDAGFLGMSIPEQYGGGGVAYLDFILALEEFNKFTPPLSRWAQSTAGGPAQLILASTNNIVREKYLRPLVTGEMEAAIAMSEAEVGSAVTDLQTRADADGDTYVVNGHKMWVGGGGDADIYDVFVRFDGIPGAKGVGGLVIERGTPGFSFGDDTGLVSQRFLTRRMLYFDNCRVPRENVLVQAGEFSRLMGAFNSERLQNTALILGCAGGAYELALMYAQERIQFGRPIVEFQLVQDMLAEMAVNLEAARMLLYRAATLTADGVTPALESSYCKLFSSQVAPRIIDLAIQVHGALGLSRDLPLERMWRDARGLALATGTVEVHKIRIVTELTGRRFDQRPPRRG
jgi:butyryl-CoA dehydrogenase